MRDQWSSSSASSSSSQSSCTVKSKTFYFTSTSPKSKFITSLILPSLDFLPPSILKDEKRNKSVSLFLSGSLECWQYEARFQLETEWSFQMEAQNPNLKKTIIQSPNDPWNRQKDILTSGNRPDKKGAYHIQMGEPHLPCTLFHYCWRCWPAFILATPCSPCLRHFSPTISHFPHRTFSVTLRASIFKMD